MGLVVPSSVAAMSTQSFMPHLGSVLQQVLLYNFRRDLMPLWEKIKKNQKKISAAHRPLIHHHFSTSFFDYILSDTAFRKISNSINQNVKNIFMHIQLFNYNIMIFIFNCSIQYHLSSDSVSNRRSFRKSKDRESDGTVAEKSRSSQIKIVRERNRTYERFPVETP